MEAVTIAEEAVRVVTNAAEAMRVVTAVPEPGSAPELVWIPDALLRLDTAAVRIPRSAASLGLASPENFPEIEIKDDF